MSGERLQIAGDVRINGVEYTIEGPVERETIDVQPGEDESEFERRFTNMAYGWGMSRFMGEGGYDYADTAVLHRKGSWLPGSALTDRTSATTPAGAISFCELWDRGTRFLVIVSPRHVYEVATDGTVTVATLTGTIASVARGMTKGVRFRATPMAAAKVFIARPSATTTDYMVARTGAGTYAISGNNKYAGAIGNAKDSDGADVLWRADSDQHLNASLADLDPDTGANWAGQLQATGEVSTRIVDITQQAQAILIGKEDGAWTFDQNARAIPITVGMQATPDAENFRWFKDFNGMAVAPTVQGIIWIDGLEWGTCGPISSNPDARNLRGREVAVSHQAGNYLYCAVYSGTTSYIFLGEARERNTGGLGKGPFVWHGPIASIANAAGRRVTDLHCSTVYGRKLWIGWRNDANSAGGWSTIELNEDFSPKSDAASGYIYLPEGSLDVGNPGVISDPRKVEFIAPASAPFAATNAWSLEVDPDGSGYVAVDGGVVNSSTYGERFFSTDRSSRRFRGIRIAYSGNAGSGECEQIIVRGVQRPEKSDIYSFTVRLKDMPRLATGQPNQISARRQEENLRTLADGGRKTAVVLGRASFTGVVTVASEKLERSGANEEPKGTITVRVRRVKLA